MIKIKVDKHNFLTATYPKNNKIKTKWGEGLYARGVSMELVRAKNPKHLLKFINSILKDQYNLGKLNVS